MTEKHTCITLWQPWASLCCIDHPGASDRPVKQYETRSWPITDRHLGKPLLIHAAKHFTAEERIACRDPLKREMLVQHYRTFRDIPLGCIVGAVVLTDCMPADSIFWHVDDYATAMGNYDDGRYAWEIMHPLLFDEPIPYRGQQGLYSVPAEVLPPEFEAWRRKLEVQHG